MSRLEAIVGLLHALLSMAFLGLRLLLATALVHVVVGQQEGFLSIDCGLDDKYSGQTDQRTGIFYFSDGPYVDAGENLKVDSEHEREWAPIYNTVRSFPAGTRNCYSLPTKAGDKYLVRLVAAYGNHDGRNDNSSIEFDLHLGANYWDTVSLVNEDTYEALFVAWASWAPVCLVNTGRGTPFLSVLELRRLPSTLYPPLTASQAMLWYDRRNMGSTSSITRYPDDLYDRYWSGTVGQRWNNLSISQDIKPDPSFMEPQVVVQTAVTSLGNDSSVSCTWQPGRTAHSFRVFLHFADFQNAQARQFDIYLNGNQLAPAGRPYSPPYLAASTIVSGWFRATDRNYNVTLVATGTSVLPPMLNAIEIYTDVALNGPATSPQDFDAIMAIKLEYGLTKKNWMGDPCFPSKYTWDGVTCTNTGDNTFRITSINLSNSSLGGAISKNFSLLTALENLDLSHNSLSGSIPDSLTSLSSLRVLNLSGNHLSPDSLCKSYDGSLIVRYDSDGDNKCTRLPSSPSSPSIPKVAIIAVSVVVPVLLVVILFLIVCFICRERRRRKPNNVQQFSTYESERDTQVENSPAIGKSKTNENRRFTYKELEKFTNNFERFIGQGGFGPVYYGRLEDNTEVAVKTRSESSSHALDHFLAEVESLTKVHHRNIVSLIGYCWENDHLALVYEYMSQGSLFDRLRGKNALAGTLNWGTRVRIVLEAAQGLDYLHKGCSPPIIHRDVKSSNILLGQNLRAKIADLGLSKTYLSDTQSHMSVSAAGTAGYMDPQYYLTGRLTESSDVYSFGIVLLEVATGEPPMVSGYGHIAQRVRQMIATGDISSVADARLGGAYDINSIWKLVDTAILCTAETPQRPAMAVVVAQLKESLALEEVREDTSTSPSRGSDIPPMASTFAPIAR